MSAIKSSFFLLLAGMILVHSSEIELNLLQIGRKIEKSKIPTKTPKLLNRIAIDLLESYSKPEDSIKMKMTDKQWRKVIGPLNLFPNESSVQLFCHNETNRMIWVDPKNLITIFSPRPNKIKKKIERCLLQKENAKAAHCLLDCIYSLNFDSEASPFVKELIFFISENVDIEKFRFNHPLLLAARYGADEAIAKLIERGANVEAVDEKDILKGWAALHIAASYGHESSCRFLIQGGANINAQRYNGMSALIAGTENGHVAVVEFLLKSGAKTNLTTHYGGSALHRAIGHPEIIKILLESGADANQEDENGKTALEVAVGLDNARRSRYKDDSNTALYYKVSVDLLKQHEAKFQK